MYEFLPILSRTCIYRSVWAVSLWAGYKAFAVFSCADPKRSRRIA